MSRGVRVLLVDDNPQDRRLVVRELRKAYPDVEILEAIDQAQLDEQLVAADFDVVVTDYHLLWSDGIQVLRAVKKRSPGCPVIMFTGTGSEEIAVEAMKQGLDDYIIKNVKHLMRLRAAVQAVIENARVKSRADQLASRFESLLSQLQVGVFSCSLEGRFLDVNAAMVHILDCESAVHVSKRTIASLFPHDAVAEPFLERVISSERPQDEEIAIVSSDSEMKFYRLSARMAGDGSEVRIEGMVEDITERKRTEAEARKSAVAAAQLAMLSPRENDVLHEVVGGSANKVIARRLDISEKTVEKHRSNLMRKLQVRSVAELVRMAVAAESGGNSDGGHAR